MTTYHVRIMNLPAPELGNTSGREGLATKYGHKQARHAAAEIALEAGFCDISHFNRRFKHRYLMTPTDLRRHKTT